MNVFNINEKDTDKFSVESIPQDTTIKAVKFHEWSPAQIARVIRITPTILAY
jgi:hypothetical protein